ncbi:pyruvate dehydrogenase (acetyl-transferring) E1 component subunit alpha [Speluncibacter jeojiensis]|uniref:Pyruvate dehydrogenase (Acetyl-transferring) E1 component subunit alpha n=1 Tax=Speluncibacter jeojiensis TaxID=2710754 RepID=A0A9X4RE37_9ACTN|nr:pyruvate dehydrogenase (acetyl-transferring) E1 component subunit alpha [Corynebacteriales bacterium D3-21]
MTIDTGRPVHAGAPDRFNLAVQLIQPDGQRVHHPDFSSLVADVGPEQLLDLYEDLVVTRRIDHEATALQRQGELVLWASYEGQEAAQVGSVRALHPDDYLFITYRESAVAHCRGVDPARMMRLWRGVGKAGWDPDELHMTNPAIIIGAQTLHATGYALGTQLDGATTATVAYFGDGATSEGDVSEALVFAASWDAPVIFFCQNNQFAISEPVRLQTPTPIAQRALGFGIPSVRVDGNDALAVLAVTRWAAARAYEGSGPTFIEAVTYRMGPHTTSDDPTRYRVAAETELWKARDPIDRVRRLLEREGRLDDAAVRRVQASADHTAARLRDAARSLPVPEPLSLFDNVYADPHPLVDDEREQYRRYLARWEEVGS